MDIHPRHAFDVIRKREAAANGERLVAARRWATGSSTGSGECDQAIEERISQCREAYRKFLDGWAFWYRQDTSQQDCELIQSQYSVSSERWPFCSLRLPYSILPTP